MSAKVNNAPAAAEAGAEALEQNNADTRPMAEAEAEAGAEAPAAVVYVFATLPGGQTFKLPEATASGSVTIEGLPVSRLKGAGGQIFAGGKYGLTRVPAEQWAEVMKIYGRMKMFTNGLVFAAPSLERGQAMARERGGLRHGFEPVDPASDRTKTKPKTED
jgi:hypothetical protein